MSIFDDPDDLSNGFPDDLPDDPDYPSSAAADLSDDVLDSGSDPVSVLDSAAAINARDPGRLLWSLATAGAQVRRSMSEAEAWRRPELRADGPPRATLVVTDTSASVAGGLLAILGGDRTAVLDWTSDRLPRWAGPADVLLAASVDGRHPRVAMLVADAQRRGLRVVVATPADTPVAFAAGRETVIAIEAPASRRAARWSLLAPLLLAAAELGIVALIDAELEAVAEVLDRVAEVNRPATDAFTNAAKQLAIEAIESEVLIAGVGPAAALAARCTAEAFALMAGITVVPLSLPDDVTRAGALIDIPIAGDADAGEDDFFRDRVEPAGRRRRLVVVSDSDPGGAASGDRARGAEELTRAGDLAVIALGRLAGARGVVSATLDLPGRSPLERFAAATAFGDFAATYAAVGRGIDPTAARAGELPH